MKKDKLDMSDYHSMLKFYHNESDRAAALLASSFLEAFLAQFLKKFMIDDQQVCDALLKGSGPLATFYARRECAYAFGHIDEKKRNDIKYIAKIRNVFAHNHKMHSFNETQITDLCQNLSTVRLNTEPRIQYLLAIAITVGSLHYGKKHKMPRKITV